MFALLPSSEIHPSGLRAVFFLPWLLETLIRSGSSTCADAVKRSSTSESPNKAASLVIRGASNSLLMMMMIVLKYAVKRYASEVVMRNKNPMKNAFYTALVTTWRAS